MAQLQYQNSVKYLQERKLERCSLDQKKMKSYRKY